MPDEMSGEINQIMFHTQQKRECLLTRPILCERKDAWLGTAYYFWAQEEDAIRWGEDSKNGNYRVYSARIISDRVMDTVFNSEHYEFFISALERMTKTIVKLTGKRPTLGDLCEYLNNRAKWKDEIDVLVVCDIPTGKREMLPIPVRKRIQAAVYNENCVHEFRLKY